MLETRWQQVTAAAGEPTENLLTRRIVNGFTRTAALQFFTSADSNAPVRCAVDVETVPQRGENDALKYRFFSTENGTSGQHIAMPEDTSGLREDVEAALSVLCGLLGVEPGEHAPASAAPPPSAPPEPEPGRLEPKDPKAFDVDKLVISRLETDPSLGILQQKSGNDANEPDGHAVDEAEPHTGSEEAAAEIEAEQPETSVPEQAHSASEMISEASAAEEPQPLNEETESEESA
jgi:hypothetical protein